LKQERAGLGQIVCSLVSKGELTFPGADFKTSRILMRRNLTDDRALTPERGAHNLQTKPRMDRGLIIKVLGSHLIYVHQALVINTNFGWIWASVAQGKKGKVLRHGRRVGNILTNWAIETGGALA
jgi:predicted anti-sigma-YlaC factor YlaD